LSAFRNQWHVGQYARIERAPSGRVSQAVTIHADGQGPVTTVAERRFPPPWCIEETPACFIVENGFDQALAYVYYEEEPGRRSAAKLLSKDEAFRIAANVAKLPELLKRA
jgi:hypothetical protein